MARSGEIGAWGKWRMKAGGSYLPEHTNAFISNQPLTVRSGSLKTSSETSEVSGHNAS